jgi:hypothetical protein
VNLNGKKAEVPNRWVAFSFRSFDMSHFEHWPLDKIRANIAQRKLADAAGCTLHVLLTTGALNPVHLGHVAQLASVAAALEARSGLTVVGAFLSPSSDVYLRGKFAAGSFFPAAVRHAACVSATRHDPLVAVGGYEVSCEPTRWPDFPEVCANLQQTLDSRKDEILFGDAASSSTAASASNSIGSAVQFKVIYCCGSDHALKCGLLTRGVRLGNERHALVACTVRAGDEARIAELGGSSSDRCIVLPALDGPLAAISSTKVREALNLLASAMHPDAIQGILSAMTQ